MRPWMGGIWHRCRWLCVCVGSGGMCLGGRCFGAWCLACVGVGAGFSEQVCQCVLAVLVMRLRACSVVPCPAREAANALHGKSDCWAWH